MAQVYTAPPHHACIISSPDREAGLELARTLAAGALCQAGGGKKACGKCRACRKISGDIHPDVQFIRTLADDKGKEKKEIVVDQIRAMAADACLLPHEAEGKVYIIDGAEKFNPQAQNAALKLLEEPPKGVTLLLCTANPFRLLPTVRSRCVEINCAAAAAQADAEQIKRAREYIGKVSRGDRAELCAFCYGLEGMNIAECDGFLRAVLELAADMLGGRSDAQGLSRGKLRHLVSLMERAISYISVNTGVKHILGMLSAASITDK